MKQKQEVDEKSIWRIKSWFPDLSSETDARLYKYYEELLKFNKTLNLIPVKSVQSADAAHFADSISAAKLIRKDMGSIKEIWDLGSGNGFPGLVFGILFPEIAVKLVDSDSKRCEFLTDVSKICGAQNIMVDNKQIESYPDNSIKCCMTRGLSSISKSIYLARKVVAPKGFFYHLKGEEWGMEVGEIPIQLCSYWAPSLIGEYKLPVGVVKFAVVKTEKLK